MKGSHTDNIKKIKKIIHELFLKYDKRFPQRDDEGIILEWSKIYQPNVDMALAWTADLKEFPIEIVEVAIEQARKEYLTELPPLGMVLKYSETIKKNMCS